MENMANSKGAPIFFPLSCCFSNGLARFCNAKYQMLHRKIFSLYEIWDLTIQKFFCK